jgi:DNA-binding winged helix-turn-helix (wHTH) protein
LAETKLSDADRLRRRRWSFAAASFDEVSWSLSVSGRRVAVEHKPLELLRELLVHAGSVVSKDDLLRRIWPNVTVVEGSLPTAIYKLRVALRDDGRRRRIIETVPGIGYRLLVPVEVEDVAPAAMPVEAAALQSAPEPSGPQAAGSGPRRRWTKARLVRLTAIVAGAAIALAATNFALNRRDAAPAKAAPPSYSQRDAANAIRRLDVGALERMLAAGWDPNLPVEAEGNAALHNAVEICEWDRDHDRHRLLLLVRTLYEGGARVDQRNVWGDTPYSIAKAERYCGPDHPVTRSLLVICSDSQERLQDRCVASYELARRTRR